MTWCWHVLRVVFVPTLEKETLQLLLKIVFATEFHFTMLNVGLTTYTLVKYFIFPVFVARWIQLFHFAFSPMVVCFAL